MCDKTGIVYSVCSVDRRASEYCLSDQSHTGMTESIYIILGQYQTHAIDFQQWRCDATHNSVATCLSVGPMLITYFSLFLNI